MLRNAWLPCVAVTAKALPPQADALCRGAISIGSAEHAGIVDSLLRLRSDLTRLETATNLAFDWSTLVDAHAGVAPPGRGTRIGRVLHLLQRVCELTSPAAGRAEPHFHDQE